MPRSLLSNRKRLLSNIVLMFGCFAWLLVSSASTLGADADANSATAPEVQPDPPQSAPVEPKPLSEHIHKGLKWLIEHQNPDGGWGQGEESSNMQGQNAENNLRDQSNVAGTCIAALSLIRAGSTPSAGVHQNQINRALDFICGQVKQSDPSSLAVTNIQGTRVQGKLGQHIDTFLAALLLAEVRNEMPDQDRRKMVIAALDKTMDKIEKNQKADGTFDNRGWAPVLAQGLAGKAVNRSAQMGADVDEKVRANFERLAGSKLDTSSGRFLASGEAAGIELYEGSAALAQLQESAKTNRALYADMADIAKSPTAKPEDRKKAEDMLERFDKNEQATRKAKQAIVNRLGDKAFIAGFGNNGGEEFLSYLNIGEALVMDGGEEWTKWDQSITKNLNQIQNKDGSWTGHHCITGRTFCTAAALLVLTVDRAPAPVAAKMKQGR